MAIRNVTRSATSSSSKRSKPKFDARARVAALPPTAFVQPDMPIAVVLQDAKDIGAAAAKIRTKLLRLPFRHELLDELPARIRALDAAEDAWRLAHTKRTPQDKKKLVAEAERLKRDLMAAGRFLLRDDDHAQAQLDRIAEGTGLADLVADLADLAKLAREYAAPFEGAILAGGTKKAVARADALAHALSAAATEQRVDSAADEAQRYRDGCYALVAEAVREVRAAARYALRDEPEKLRPFRNTYMTRRNARHRSRSTPPPAPEA